MVTWAKQVTWPGAIVFPGDTGSLPSLFTALSSAIEARAGSCLVLDFSTLLLFYYVVCKNRNP